MLKRDFSFRFANVFDTMLAARILGWRHVSLAALLAQHFGVTLDKRAQLTDWGHRPLDGAQLSYARLDTHYLLPLRDLLIAELRQRRRWREAPETRSPGCPRSPTSKNRLTRMASGGTKVRAISAAVNSPCCASFICGATNRRARLDRPPFKVLGDDRLVDLSRRQPARLADLPLNPRQIDLFGRAILAAIAAGRNDPIPSLPPRPSNGNGRPTPEALARFDQLRAWRVRRAADRAVDADLILNNDALMTIARAAPATLEALAALGVMGAWKLEEYGPDLLRVIGTGA